MNYTGQTATMKIESITPETLVAGIDIAKQTHCAQFVDCRGIVVAEKAFFTNSSEGCAFILSKIDEVRKSNFFSNAIVAFEPTGHYWKTLAFRLGSEGPDAFLPTHSTQNRQRG